MNDKTTITMRINRELKEDVNAIFKEFGLDLTTATMLYYRQVVKEHNIPFIIGDEKLTPKFKKIINKARREAKNSKGYCSFEEFKKSLE